MKRALSYPLSVIFYFFFFLNLLIFHPIQWISHKLGGYSAHKKSVDIFNLFLMRCLNILGTSFSIENEFDLPEDKTCIFIANHQGMYDIPPIIWHFRKHHPKFVSKKELGKGIPSISYNLRHGGSVLIDRKNRRESLIKMSKFADYLARTKRSAVIFPEGTRSRTGEPKKFQVNGMMMLFKKLPDAVVVPVTINNSWKLFRNGNFPMDLGVNVRLKTHQPIPVNSKDPEALAAEVERIIIADIR
ncbi:lysophospholipid acyltransferase family protein [Christiangramia salexigens]|uniref:1-acyl-sn-glycerol-3-phosphate acyltransferase n=1 Tax=Christiangramia salexigens TaxID=1913577 RepID=A0A1L3J6V3_9FLAO|nr:lysophospholipid acyltransferase family protein [Christiangramia salexigens]APG60875.1 1-acyl-sn-glycerol-3-phosphate acyltransferase [Christiangramia salexigens]